MRKDKYFWKSEGRKVTISSSCIIEHLGKVGFAKYYPDPNGKAHLLVKMYDNIVDIATKDEILEYLINSIQSDKMQLVEDALRKHAHLYLSDLNLSTLPKLQDRFLEDDFISCHFFFTNGIIEVMRKGNVTIKEYRSLDRYVWKKQIRDFKIKLTDSKDCDFEQFVEKVSGGGPRFDQFRSVLGYLLHKHKDPTQIAAVIIAEETEDENEGGGTGKGIFARSIGKLRNIETLDGKTFRPDSSFAFQRVDPATDIILVDDSRKGLPFEIFYSMISDGLTIEGKGKKQFYLPFSKSPKWMFTTNYTLSNVGNHAKRRQTVIEFTNFFNFKNKPNQHFGHRLYDDWEYDEWNRFYNFMFVCTAEYLEHGIIEIGLTKSIQRKSVVQNYGEEFLDFWTPYSDKINEKIHVSPLYQKFLEDSNTLKKDFSSRKMWAGINDCGPLFGYTLRKERSNGVRWALLEPIKVDHT